MAALLCRMCWRTLLYTRYRSHQLLGIRNLLSDVYCKYNSFLQQKKDTALFFYNDKDTFFENIQVKLEESLHISEQDLKTMIYLCETESDVQLLKKCLLRHYKNVPDTDYEFGPLFIRLCYSLGDVNTAFEMLKEKSFRRMISNYTSFNLMVDLFYKHGEYEKAMEVLQEMKAQGYRLNKVTYILAFAICYQLNDLQTFNTFLEEAVTNQTELSRQALCFAVALNLKKGEYELALICYDKIVKKDVSICHNLKLLLAAKLGQEKKLLQMLQTAANGPRSDILSTVKFSKEVIDFAEEKLSSTNSCKIFHELYNKLVQSKQITTLTMDQMLHSWEEYDDYGYRLHREEK